MAKPPFLKSYFLTDRMENAPTVYPLFAVNFLVSTSTHNPADVSERAVAIIQCIYFGEDVREAIAVCEAALVKENPDLEIVGVLNALSTEFQSSQLVPRPGAGDGAYGGSGIVLPGGDRFQH